MGQGQYNTQSTLMPAGPYVPGMTPGAPPTSQDPILQRLWGLFQDRGAQPSPLPQYLGREGDRAPPKWARSLDPALFKGTTAKLLDAQRDKLAPDVPGAEPLGDIRAQDKDLADPKHQRRGLYMSPATVQHIKSLPGGKLELSGVGIRDFAQPGDVLVAQDQKTAAEAVARRNAGEPPQAIIGELTQSGGGKPRDAAAVVQQVTPDGAVTRETVVRKGEVGPKTEELAVQDRAVRVVGPQESLGRRAAGIMAEQQNVAVQAPQGPGEPFPRHSPGYVGEPGDYIRKARGERRGVTGNPVAMAIAANPAPAKGDIPHPQQAIQGAPMGGILGRAISGMGEGFVSRLRYGLAAAAGARDASEGWSLFTKGAIAGQLQHEQKAEASKKLNQTVLAAARAGVPPELLAVYIASGDLPGLVDLVKDIHKERRDVHKPTDEMREYQLYREQGGALPFFEYKQALKKSGAQNIQIKNEGNIPPGYKAIRDAQGNVLSLEPIPGSPAAVEARQMQKKEAGQAAMAERSSKVVMDDIGRAMKLAEGDWTTGLPGAALRQVPATGAHDLVKVIDTIKANVGFDRLQQMRAASPTGGALGPVSDFENRMLQSVLGSLETSQSREQLNYNLRRLNDIYLDIIHGPGNGPPRILGGEEKKAEPAKDGAAPEGVDPELWKHMTPEERALWQN